MEKFQAKNRCLRCGAFTHRCVGSICARCGKLTDKYGGGYIIEPRPRSSWWVAGVLALPLIFWLLMAAMCFSAWIAL